MKSQEVTTDVIEFNGKKYLVEQTTGELLEILSDKSPIGKERPWRKHKKENMTVKECYSALSDKKADGDYWAKKADRLESCGTHLTFNVYNGKEGRTMKI